MIDDSDFPPTVYELLKYLIKERQDTLLFIRVNEFSLKPKTLVEKEEGRP